VLAGTGISIFCVASLGPGLIAGIVIGVILIFIVVPYVIAALCCGGVAALLCCCRPQPAGGMLIVNTSMMQSPGPQAFGKGPPGQPSIGMGNPLHAGAGV